MIIPGQDAIFLKCLNFMMMAICEKVVLKGEKGGGWRRRRRSLWDSLQGALTPGFSIFGVLRVISCHTTSSTALPGAGMCQQLSAAMPPALCRAGRRSSSLEHPEVLPLLYIQTPSQSGSFLPIRLCIILLACLI